MLVLTRKRHEAVFVERVRRVTGLQVQGGIVRLGFEVEADIAVQRLEVWERLRAHPSARKPTESRARDPACVELPITSPVGGSPTETS